jgi:hypothetical protein
MLGRVSTCKAEVWALAFETERPLYTCMVCKKGRIARDDAQKVVVGEFQEKCAEEVRDKEEEGLYSAVLY